MYLDATYEDPDRKGTAESALGALKLGNGDSATHYAKFCSIIDVRAVLRGDDFRRLTT